MKLSAFTSSVSPLSEPMKLNGTRAAGSASQLQLSTFATSLSCSELAGPVNKYTDSKKTKRNGNISEQQCDNTTGTWRMRWEITSRLKRLFHLVTATRIHKMRKLTSSEIIRCCNSRIQRHHHACKECCNLCCKHLPFSIVLH